MDHKYRDELIRALENLTADNSKYELRREKQLWKEVNIPCSLFDTINRLSKTEMDRIRKNLELKNLSSLRKAELASKLVNLIPLKFNKVLYTLDQGRYGLIQAVVNNSGVIYNINISTSEAESLMGYSILFPGTHNDQKVLYMPPELVEVFLNIDGADLEKKVKRNTEWILITQGLLYYYGVMSVTRLVKRINELTRQEVDLLEYINVMSPAIDFYKQVKNCFHGYQDHRVIDAGKIIEEHNMRRDIDYHQFTKKQLIKAGMPDYIDTTPAMNRFLKFLSESYDLNNEDKNEIAMQLINMINLDARPEEIIQKLQSQLEFPTFDFIQVLTANIIELYNNTRQWALKGYTPDELFQKEKKYLKPLPSETNKIQHKESKVVNIKTRNKIGRNQPCPCGSGKKYKKCCGS